MTLYRPRTRPVYTRCTTCTRQFHNQPSVSSIYLNNVLYVKKHVYLENIYNAISLVWDKIWLITENIKPIYFTNNHSRFNVIFYDGMCPIIFMPIDFRTFSFQNVVNKCLIFVQIKWWLNGLYEANIIINKRYVFLHKLSLSNRLSNSDINCNH